MLKQECFKYDEVSEKTIYEQAIRDDDGIMFILRYDVEDLEDGAQLVSRPNATMIIRGESHIIEMGSDDFNETIKRHRKTKEDFHDLVIDYFMKIFGNGRIQYWKKFDA